MNKKSLQIHTKEQIRWDLYPMFLKLIEHGFTIEALLFILSTWNFARFRYAMRTFDLGIFTSIINKLRPTFNKIKKYDFRTINFDKHADKIKYIFIELSNIKGIEKTGASKLMHLLAPNIFVMWDMYIRNYYGFKRGDAEDYLCFLKKMQKEFSGLKIKSERTLAKLIDEHNYNTITEQIFKGRRKNKKKEVE